MTIPFEFYIVHNDNNLITTFHIDDGRSAHVLSLALTDTLLYQANRPALIRDVANRMSYAYLKDTIESQTSHIDIDHKPMLIGYLVNSRSKEQEYYYNYIVNKLHEIDNDAALLLAR